MSGGQGMPFEHAVEVAKHVSDELAPHCVRSRAVGSLRRRRDRVSDIEFLIEPKMITADLFGGNTPDIASIRAVAEYCGKIIKGGDKYIQIAGVMASSLKCDFFICSPPAEWSVLLAIRTGPAKLSQHAVTRMRDYGRYCENGRILVSKTGEQFPTPEEADFFSAAGLSCLKPWERDSPRAYLPVDISRPVNR